jgi:hypothetical protein
VERLVADAPAFFQALGASVGHVGTLADDVRTLVDDGGDSALNPFKIQVLAGPGSNGTG